MTSGRFSLWQALGRGGLVALGVLAFLTVTQGRAAADPKSTPGSRADQTAVAMLTEEGPTAFLEEFSQRALQMLADGTLTADQRRDELQRFFRAGFDLEAISRFVLGRHWRGASETERREFMGLFETFIVGFYADKFDGYAGETLRMGSSRSLDDQTTQVSSKILRPGAASIRVDWRLKRVDESWQIVDVVVEGVSLAIVQRSEFDSVIRNNGGKVEGLLAVLRQKTTR